MSTPLTLKEKCEKAWEEARKAIENTRMTAKEYERLYSSLYLLYPQEVMQDVLRALRKNRVSIKAKVTKKLTDKTNVDRLVLEDVIVGGSYFRDHCWVKNTKRLSLLSVGDKFTATALMYVYSSSEGQKLGLKTFRNVEKI